MASGNLVYKRQEYRVVRRYFTGTDTIVAGQPFCYQESPATGSSTKGFPFDVEIPNTANQRVFAGIAAPSAVGITGPDYIDIIVPQPGDILQVMVSNGAALSVGDVLSLDWDVPTSSLTELGAFNALTNITATGSVAGTVLQPLIGDIVADAHVQMLASQASSAVAARVLHWVKFVK